MPSIFRTPPPPPWNATAIAAVREHLIRKIKLLYRHDPETALMAEADTIFMDNHQLQAYVALCGLGTVHHETAATLVQRTPHNALPECVRQLSEAEA
jgi:hypothetical protein